MVYIVISLVGIYGLWALSEWYTEKKIDILMKRIEHLEELEIKRLREQEGVPQIESGRNGKWHWWGLTKRKK